MRVIDREYAIQLMMTNDLYDTEKLQKILFNGFLGYDNMGNEQLLEIYNNNANRTVHKVV